MNFLDPQAYFCIYCKFLFANIHLIRLHWVTNACSGLQETSIFQFIINLFEHLVYIHIADKFNFVICLSFELDTLIVQHWLSALLILCFLPLSISWKVSPKCVIWNACSGLQ